MPSTRTPGITVSATGERIIDKEHRGVRIYARLRPIDFPIEHIELAAEVERVEDELLGKAVRPRFADAAARYLEESCDLRSVDVTAWHVRLLSPYIGTLELKRVHDGTLGQFIADRLADGVTATTINRSLEVVRTVLNRAARSYRDDDGRPWLEGVPSLIKMREETRRLPYPITWEEQDRLFPKLPARLARISIRGQHRIARKQCVRPAVDVGGSSARNRSQCVRDSGGSVQIEAPACHDTQRCCLVHHRGATRTTSHLGLSIPRERGCHNEQHCLAARAP